MDNPGPSHLKSAMCDICGKAFTPGNLKKHMRMHGDNRHKKCTYCDREFPTYKAMTGHRKFAHAEQYKADRDGQTVAQLPRVSLYMLQGKTIFTCGEAPRSTNGPFQRWSPPSSST